MRIISEFYDYYDSIAKVMFDNSVVYNRQTKIIEGARHWSWDKGLTKTVSIYFCDYLFYGTCFQMKDLSYSKYMYDGETINKFVSEHFSKELNTKHRGFYRNPYHLRYISDYDSFYKNRTNPSKTIWDSYGVPIVAYQNNNRIHNPRLNDFNFQTVKDPYTAFQELYMYLGSKAKPEKPIPQPTDKVMAEIKGFDKYSFRKDKAKK